MSTTRADVITRRTYSRPIIGAPEETFEDWEQIRMRVVGHQQWLWSRALGRSLNEEEWEELDELGALIQDRKALPSGRTLWLGGTEVAKQRESSQFNCSFLRVETVHDVVDALWLLLQGCGVGFEPLTGTLSGFTRSMEITTIRSERTSKGGRETNEETFDEDGVWTVSVGDSAEAWAKSLGKLLAGKYPANKLVLDFSQVRPAGDRLAGYGWICSGDQSIARAWTAIAELLNARAGQLLTARKITRTSTHSGESRMPSSA